MQFGLLLGSIMTEVDGLLSLMCLMGLRVSAFTSLTVEPLGRQVWYETGQWWTFVNSLVDGFQTSYDVNVGGSTGIQTYHYYFPGDAGIVVADDPALELGNQWDIDI